MPIFDRIKSLKSRLPKTRRGKIVLYSAAGVAAFFFIVSVGVGVWSGYPSFCRSCHHIRPHYRSWASSKHGKENVNCVGCHFEPGIVPYVAGKLNGLVEVVKYVTGGYPTKLRSDVPDVSCLREDCHSKEEVTAEDEEFGKTRFKHKKHFEALRGGTQLRCASCHSTSLHSKDETVSTRVCFTCHFAPTRAEETAKERRVRESQGKCETCHELPKKVVTQADTSFEHEKYATSDLECFRCHAHVTEGDGAALKERCHTCHNEGLGHLDRFAETEFIHENHVSHHQVACYECHGAVRHGLKGTIALGTEACGGLHAARHGVAQKLYAGTGGVGVKDKPDAMFVAAVQCVGCHVPEDTEEVTEVPKANCEGCHEPGYEKLPKRWKLAFEEYLEGLDGLRERAASVPASAARGKLLAEVKHNVEFVREAVPAHNVRYAADCLRRAEAQLVEILAPAGLDGDAIVIPTLEMEAGRCVETCHFGVETVGTLKFLKRDLSHRKHVLSPRAPCIKCHDFDEEKMGETLLAKVSECNACHHNKEEEENCASCHSLQEAIYVGKVPNDPRCKPTKRALKKVKCAECHRGLSDGHSLEEIRQECLKCHKNKQAFGRMLSEYQDGIREGLDELKGLVDEGKALAAEPRLSQRTAARLRQACSRAEEAEGLVREDGSFGAHNIDYLDTVVSDAAEEIEKAIHQAKGEKGERAATGEPPRRSLRSPPAGGTALEGVDHPSKEGRF